MALSPEGRSVPILRGGPGPGAAESAAAGVPAAPAGELPGGTAEDARTGGPIPVPPLLANAAGWVWRLLVLAAASYALVWLLNKLYLLVLPLIAAILISALLRPVVNFFRRRGLPRGLATWSTIILGFLVIGGVLFFVVNRIQSDAPQLAEQATRLIGHLHRFAVHDLHISAKQINSVETKAVNYINSHRTSLAKGVLTGVLTVAKVLTGLLECFFITFFLLYDGDNIWGWLVRLFPARSRSRVREAGDEAWSRIAGWVRGTFLIACFHAIVVSVTLAGLGAPLVLPLALLVFLGSFIPIVGSVIFGALAALVTLVDVGVVPALILVGVLVVDNQIEAHGLQPFLVGRYVRVHPLAVVLVIAAGGFLEGVVGAIIALPLTSAIYAALQSFSATAGRERLQVPAPTLAEPPS
jgi:predicted PurR-regulated permease PerM